MEQIEWEVFKKAYANYVELYYAQPCPAAISDFLEFIGINFEWARDHEHSNQVEVPAESINRIKALAGPHYVAMAKAMRIQDEE